MTGERLRAIDAAYLDIEKRHVPLHVASIATFEAGPFLDDRGVFRLDEVRARIASRLHLLPRLRQKAVDVPFGVARPVWVDDPRFDIANHVDVVSAAAPGDEAALLRVAEDIVMAPLDRDQPLWHLRFVVGLDGDRVALVERAHHAMVDGVSGVDVSMVLLDTAPDAPASEPVGWEPPPEPDPVTLLTEGVLEQASAPLRAISRMFATVSDPTAAAQRAREMAHALGTVFFSDGLAPRSTINRYVGGSRQILVVRERFDRVHDVGARAGATVNDVVLTAVAGGLRTLFAERGELLAPDRILRVLIPVSMREETESMTLGNRVGGLAVSLPIGIGDPHERLAAVRALTQALKDGPEANATDALLRAADWLPPAVTNLIGRGVHRQPFVNLVVTNIPGPPFPLYAMGARMLEAVPVVPLAENMDLEVAVLSYDGALTLGITADRKTCPDADVFAAGVEHSFEALGARWSRRIA